MSVQIKGDQIQNSTVTSAKIDATGTWDFSSATLRANSTPSHDNDVATKSYVLDLVQGLEYKDSCDVATQSAPAATYNNGAGTLTYNSSGALTIDSIALSVDNRVLVKSFAGAASVANGIYTVTNAGAVAAAAVLTRAADMNENDEFPSAAVFIKQGSDADSLYVCQQDAVTIGTTQISFAQASGAGSISAGSGLDKSGNTLSVSLAANKGLEFDGSADLQIKAFNGITLSSDGVAVQLDGSTLQSTGSGVKVSNLGIGSAQLAAQAVSAAKLGAVAGNGLTGGAGSSLAVQANGAGPISVSGSGVDIALDGSTISKSSSGIKISDDAIGPDQLAAQAVGSAALGAVAGNGLTGGAGSVLAVQANGAGPISVGGSGVDIALDGSTLAKSSSGIKVDTGAITSNELAAQAVGAAALGAVAGNGLTGGAGSALAVEPNSAGPVSVSASGVDIALDGSTLSKSSSGLKVGTGAISSNELAAQAVGSAALGSIAGNGLTGGAGSSLAVQANGAGPISVSASGVDITLDGSTLAKSASGIKLNNGAVDSAQLAANAVGAAALGIAFTFEDFTGNGSATTFDLQHPCPATLIERVIAFRNGLRMKLVQSNPSGTDEYTVSATGGASGVCRITTGSAMSSADKLFVDYIYEPS